MAAGQKAALIAQRARAEIVRLNLHHSALLPLVLSQFAGLAQWGRGHEVSDVVNISGDAWTSLCLL